MTPMITLAESIERLAEIGRDFDPMEEPHEHSLEVQAIRCFVDALLGWPGPGRVVEMMREELGENKAATPRPAVQLHRTGVPMNANDWTEQDWADLHRATESAIVSIAQRHNPNRMAGGGLTFKEAAAIVHGAKPSDDAVMLFAHELCAAGWRETNDAQWAGLARLMAQKGLK